MKSNLILITIIAAFLFSSCTKNSNLRCENGYLNSVGDNVENCECKPGYRPDIKLPLVQKKGKDWDGVSCTKLPYISNGDVLPIFTKQLIGNRYIEKGLIYYSDDIFAFNSDYPDDWQSFSGIHEYARINMYQLPDYTFQSFNSFDARSIRQPVPDSKDSIQIDLRSLPNRLGYTDAGEGIFIAFRIDRYSHPTKTLFLNPMIHITSSEDDNSFTPIKSYPIDIIE